VSDYVKESPFRRLFTMMYFAQAIVILKMYCEPSRDCNDMLVVIYRNAPWYRP